MFYSGRHKFELKIIIILQRYQRFFPLESDNSNFNNNYMTVIFIITYTIKLNLLISLFAVLQTACLWAMRCLAIQRQLSDENNEIKKNKIFTLMEKGLFFTGFHIF